MKCAILFPGYGNKFVGMGKELYDESRIIQSYFEHAIQCLNINFVQVCFASSEHELRRPVNAYTSLFLLSSSCYALLQERSIIPEICTGFNIGGYAALHAGEALSFPDGLYMLHKLATFYEECMLQKDVIAFRVQGLPEDEVQNLCQASSTEEQWVAIGAYEDEQTFVVVGHYDVAEPLREYMHKMRNIKAKSYPMEAGAYAPICDDMMLQYKPYLEKIDYHDLTHPVIASDGTTIHSRDAVRSMLLNQLFQPAYYDRMVARLAEYDAVIVPTPAQRTVAYLQAHLQETPVYPLTHMQDLDTIEKNIIHRNEEE